jgi:hypothetical protein
MILLQENHSHIHRDTSLLSKDHCEALHKGILQYTHRTWYRFFHPGKIDTVSGIAGLPL